MFPKSFYAYLYNIECKYRVCAYNLVAVRHFMCCECFSVNRTDVSCFATKMRLLDTIQIDRCDAFVYLTLLLSNSNANVVFVCVSLLLCGSLYIMNVLSVIEQICLVLRLKCVCLRLFRSTDKMHLFA